MSAPSQPPLWIDSVYDALGAIVSHLGGAKSVGAMFWPAKSAHDAGKLLKDCLNPDRAEKLDPEQILMLFRLARDAGYHDAKHWLDRETGYVPSEPANPQDEQTRLVAAIESAAETMKHALAELDKMRARPAPTLTRVV